MRLFVEAVLDQAALDFAAATSRSLWERDRSLGRALRWVKPEAMHLTLRFLGEAPAGQVGAISEVLETLAGSGRIELVIGGVGSFGGRRPRVIWLGIDERGRDDLQRLRFSLDERLESVGIAADDGLYRPHLTLARVRRQATSEQLADIHQLIKSAPSRELSSTIHKVALVHSTLMPEGPRYRRVAIVEL